MDNKDMEEKRQRLKLFTLKCSIYPIFKFNMIWVSYKSVKSQDSENISLETPERFFTPQNVGP